MCKKLELKDIYVKCHELRKSQVELILNRSVIEKNKTLLSSEEYQYLSLNLKGLWGNYKNPPEGKTEINLDQLWDLIDKSPFSKNNYNSSKTLKDEVLDYKNLSNLIVNLNNIKKATLLVDEMRLNLGFSKNLDLEELIFNNSNEGLPIVKPYRGTNFSVFSLTEKSGKIFKEFFTKLEESLEGEISDLKLKYYNDWGKFYK